MKKTLLLAILLVLASGQARAGDYVIGDGDTLVISVWGVKELSTPVRVRPDGKITIPAIGDVVATGYTPAGLQEVLTERLKSIVKNPTVNVIVEGINNSKVYVFGGGVKSGVVDLNKRTTLLQLLCQISETKGADLKRAYVQRDGKKVKEDFYDLFITGKTSDDIVIEPNDVIFMPVLLERSVYVVGAVNTPKFIEYREGLTVMEAVLEAGGFTKFANQNGVTVFRKNGDNKRSSIPVRAEDLTKKGDLSQNLALSPGDYVVVREGLF
ncbi:MAG TPA: sugar ABC transporter substrate-binding protein [Deltaproteobacteria bacterium]|nr:MAG: sugar ABC transporter substrate-binding protein [Deltaproteobacteria bacterium GWA2_55_82]OGQ64611.1 MAG: sugar ABC transporter substrate-binding protein [Deltaproteobacteria bacterium RIFCSPLOWO2_02_FULL_55_12]OIJ73709.1 MAG: sugar ABC transporter substrate-binding protein [Deltaproteobacteria bacterium GWC2_55_46]HBG45897.1 sugar ABC transporter substrate-binding protein [Deltaproteobacteria bacterium]HCY09684.1 sugar ABC transporter substrate-binding protein [Deltaproteobacteria bact